MNKHARPVDPRAEHVAVRRLGPACVRQVPVNVRRTEIHPIRGRNDVPQAVAGARHLRHFGVSGRATRKEHLHCIRA